MQATIAGVGPYKHSIRKEIDPPFLLSKLNDGQQVMTGDLVYVVTDRASQELSELLNVSQTGVICPEALKQTVADDLEDIAGSLDGADPVELLGTLKILSDSGFTLFFRP